ncbi:hypothetical protein PS2_009613 [Malus domestica]
MRAVLSSLHFRDHVRKMNQDTRILYLAVAGIRKTGEEEDSAGKIRAMRYQSRVGLSFRIYRHHQHKNYVFLAARIAIPVSLSVLVVIYKYFKSGRKSKISERVEVPLNSTMFVPSPVQSNPILSVKSLIGFRHSTLICSIRLRILTLQSSM